jgi:hypothetical protein
VVIELLNEGLTEDEVVQVLVDNGFDEIRARQIVAQELGRDHGDCIALEKPA